MTKTTAKPANQGEKTTTKQAAVKANGIRNWFNKYPETNLPTETTENPAMILDEDESLKQKIREKCEMKSALDNYMSPGRCDKNCKNRDQVEESHDLSDLNDTLNMRSASQVPLNLPFNNPSYLYEEQEGSIDLRSECSFMAKNNSFLNNNLPRIKNTKMPSKNGNKNVNSWKEVF